MAGMGAPNRSDTTCVARHRKPVVNGGPDTPALHRWFARPMVSSY